MLNALAKTYVSRCPVAEVMNVWKREKWTNHKTASNSALTPYDFRGSYLWEFLDLIHTNFHITTKLGKEPVVQYKKSKFLTRRPWLSWHLMTPYWTSPIMLNNAYFRNYRKNRKHWVRKFKFIAYVLYMCMYIWYKFYNFFQFPSWWAKAWTMVNYYESRSFCLTLVTYSTHMIWIMLYEWHSISVNIADTWKISFQINWGSLF